METQIDAIAVDTSTQSTAPAAGWGLEKRIMGTNFPSLGLLNLRQWSEKAVRLWMAMLLGHLAALATPSAPTWEGPTPANTGPATAAVGLPQPNTEIRIALTLRLRNWDTLQQLLADQIEPSSEHYHHYLTPDEFSRRFGPPPEDYEAVAAFAIGQHLRIVQRHPNRTVLEVCGSVADLERAFQVRLQTYRHPTEGRIYFAPDRHPTPAQPIPLLQVFGLDTASVVRPAGIRLNPLPRPDPRPVPLSIGSDPSGLYIGRDFRSAYVPGTVLTGTGESVALVEFDGYYANDISSYLKRANLSTVPLTNIYLNGVSGVPGMNNSEVSLDICMTQCMAPALKKILVYQGLDPITILNRIATDNAARQICCSWLWLHTHGTASLDQVLSQFAAQGQSFFSAAGDTGAYTTGTPSPTDSPLATSVGGTALTILLPGGNWFSEQVWNWHPTYFVGSGGGVSSNYTIPNWQSSVSMGINRGSNKNRNIPDVSLVADNILTFANNGVPYGAAGTSAAAPLWAGFCALVNQQSISAGKSPVGRLNPALYALGRGTNYSLAFHDVTIGNNTNQNSGETRYLATYGYDLCSGWGSPNGTGLINLLSPPVAPVITSSSNSVEGFSGRSVTLTFSAIGSPLLSYQWRLNGTPIAGATSTQLVLNNLDTKSTGVYSVSVTNSYGTATSVVANLQIIEGVDTPLWSPWHLALFGSGLFVLARRTLSNGRVRGQTG